MFNETIISSVQQNHYSIECHWHKQHLFTTTITMPVGGCCRAGAAGGLGFRWLSTVLKVAAPPKT